MEKYSLIAGKDTDHLFKTKHVTGKEAEARGEDKWLAEDLTTP